jgi:hypothetical protein
MHVIVHTILFPPPGEIDVAIISTQVAIIVSIGVARRKTSFFSSLCERKRLYNRGAL